MKNHRPIALVALLFLFVSCNSSLSDLKPRSVQMSDGCEVVYKTYGTEEPALVFIHGFGCDMEAWREQYPYFEGKNRMIFIDLPGYGESDKPKTEYTLDYYAESVKAVMDAMKVDSAVLIGHSLGTPVARQVRFNYPSLVAKLVDVDGVYCFYPEDPVVCAENEGQYALFTSIFAGEDISETMKEFILPLFVEETPASVRDYALSTMVPTPSYIASSTMNHLIEKKYWTGEVISVPSLIMASKNSQIPTDYRDIMGALYSAVSYCEFDHIGHFIMMEDPVMFNHLLDDFVNQ